MRHVYIHASGSYLPGPPVDNDSIEDCLGYIGDLASPYKNIVLAKNGIRFRHYVREKECGVADLAARAILRAVDQPTSFLAVASSQPDALVPGIASHVHGKLGWPSAEIMNLSGVCSAGIMALKTAYWAVASGEHTSAVACAAELPSRFFRAEYLRPFVKENARTLPADLDFLRWMLSDGAGAVALSSFARKGELSLRIDWIDCRSHAGRLPTCMYAGALKKQEGGDVDHFWGDYPNSIEAAKHGMFTLRQDLSLLKHMLPMGIERLQALIQEGRVRLEETNWFLFHFSSMKFYRDARRKMAELNQPIPEEKLFTNLSTKGNTGSASFFIMLDELMRSGRLRQGQKILGMIPESGRFNMCFLQLTCVSSGEDNCP